MISDEEMWGTVEAILETKPQQELVHEPQTTSCLPSIPQPTEQTSEQETPISDEETEPVNETVEQPKPKKKRKKQTEEVAKTNEEN